MRGDVEGVTILPGVEIYKLVTVPPVYRGNGSGHGCFGGVCGLFVSVESGGVSGDFVGVLSVKVSSSFSVTIRRNTGLMEINATLFKGHCCVRWGFGWDRSGRVKLFSDVGGVVAVPRRSRFRRRVGTRERRAEGARPRGHPRRPHMLKNGPGDTRPNTVRIILMGPSHFRSMASVTSRLGTGGAIILGLRIYSHSMSQEVVSFLDNTTCTGRKDVQGITISAFVVMPAGISMVNRLVARSFSRGHVCFW